MVGWFDYPKEIELDQEGGKGRILRGKLIKENDMIRRKISFSSSLKSRETSTYNETKKNPKKKI